MSPWEWSHPRRNWGPQERAVSQSWGALPQLHAQAQLCAPGPRSALRGASGLSGVTAFSN